VLCGGPGAIACASNSQFCELAPGDCASVMDPTGVCATKPTGCETTFAPVCGCNGRTYTNDCERRAAGIAKWVDGACSAATCPAMAPQGGATCTQGSIACVYAISTGPDAGCVERVTCNGGVWSVPVVVCP